MPGANGAESATAAEGAVRARDSLFHWCGTVDAIEQTSGRPEKRMLLDAYFEAVAEETIAPAARFFAGAFFPLEDGRPSRVDRKLVIQAIQDLARIDLNDLRARTEPGALGDMAAEAFAGRLPSGIAVSEVSAWGEALAKASRPAACRALMREMLARTSSLEARYLVKLITGEFDIGVDPADVEAAVAARFAQPQPRRGVDRRKNTSEGPLPGQKQRRRGRA
jgi:DNA ligase-1